MKTRSVTPMKLAKAGYIIMSAVFCAVGLLFILLPELSTVIIGRALGTAMLIFGGIKLAGYFSKDLFRLAFQYDLEFGILLIALGLIVLVRSTDVMNFIFIALGISIFADGLFKVRIALEAKAFGITEWLLILILAILTGFAGLLLVFRPAESAKILTRLLGISLLAEGILNLCVTLSTVKIVRHQQPDVPEANYYEL